MRTRTTSLSPDTVECTLSGEYLGLCRTKDLPDLRALERSLRRSEELRWSFAVAVARIDGHSEVRAWLRRYRPQGFGVHLQQPQERSLEWSAVAAELVRVLLRKVQ